MSPINKLTGLSGGEIGAYFCDFESCPNSSQRTAIGHDPRASMAMWHGEGGRRSQQRGMERERCGQRRCVERDGVESRRGCLREGWQRRRDMEREGRQCHVETVGLQWQHGMKREGQGCRRGMEREWGDRQEGQGAAVTGNGEGEGSNDKRERGSGNAAWRVVVAMQRRDGGVIETHPVAFEARMGFNRFWSKGGGRLAERREDIQ